MQAFFGCHGTVDVAKLLEEQLDGKARHLRVDQARLQLAHVQQIGQQRAQAGATGLDMGQDLAVLGFDARLEHVDEQGQRRQRLAQVVAGKGKESALGDIGRIGLRLGNRQRRLGLFELGDVQRNAAQQWRPVGAGNSELVHLVGAQLAVRAGDLFLKNRAARQQRLRIGRKALGGNLRLKVILGRFSPPIGVAQKPLGIRIGVHVGAALVLDVRCRWQRLHELGKALLHIQTGQIGLHALGDVGVRHHCTAAG